MIKPRLSSSLLSSSSAWPYALLFVLSLVAFSPALFCIYALSDDYVYLWSSITGSAHGLGNNFVWSLGRVIWALVYPYIFQLVGSVEALGWLRAVTLLCVWLTASMLFSALHKNGFSISSALAAACLLAFSPASGLIVSWTAAANIAAANLLAAAAAWTFVYQIDRPQSRLSTIGVFALHTALLFPILTIYQTSIGFFPLMVLALTYKRIQSRLRDCLPVIYSFAAFTLSSALFTLFYWQWIVPRWGYALYQDAARIRIDLDKLTMVAVELIYAPLSHWGKSFTLFIALSVFLVHLFWIASGLLSLRHSGLRTAILKILCLGLVAATTLGASALLSFQPSQSLSGVVGLYALLIAIGLASAETGKLWLNRFRRAYLWTLFCLLPLISATLLYQDLIQMNQLEYRLMRDRIVEETADGLPAHMTLVTSPYVMAETPPQWLPTVSRALYSTTFAWVLDPLWNLVLLQTQDNWLEQTQKNPNTTQLHFSPNPHQPEPSIHAFKEIEGHDFPRVRDPHFDDVLEIRDNWYFSDWFGYFQRMDAHWINHPILGHFAVLDREGDTLFVRSWSTDWTLIPHEFPNIRINNEIYRLDLGSYHWGQILVQNLETGEFRTFPFH
ncbi:MAG: hypothetical protein JJU20_12215 [Opitutales bacterium]|nr:hypothetical protein [Opitutales bacterium]